MNKYNFQDWLKTKVSNDSEVILAGKLEYLRLYLTDAMRELRTKAGLTQAQLAEKLGVQQAAVSKLESALKEHQMESVLHYLYALDADLLVAVKQGEELYQVSDNHDVVLVDVPVEVQKLAKAEGISLREYVHAAIEHFSQKSGSVIDALTAFLESDDSVAVRVRERLGERSPLEFAPELERCWNLPEQDRSDAVMDLFLADGVTAGETNRNSNDSNDGFELVELVDDLLEKLAEILGNYD